MLWPLAITSTVAGNVNVNPVTLEAVKSVKMTTSVIPQILVQQPIPSVLIYLAPLIANALRVTRSLAKNVLISMSVPTITKVITIARQMHHVKTTTVAIRAHVMTDIMETVMSSASMTTNVNWAPMTVANMQLAPTPTVAGHVNAKNFTRVTVTNAACAHRPNAGTMIAIHMFAHSSQASHVRHSSAHPTQCQSVSAQTFSVLTTMSQLSGLANLSQHLTQAETHGELRLASARVA
jgi:hypothetical protein